MKSSERLTIKQVHEKYKSGELDLLQWNKTFLENISKKEDNIHAWEYLDRDVWLKKCEAIIAGKSPVFDALFGVPVGVKDIFNTIDMPTQMGSSLWKGFTPGNDARVVYDIKMNGGFVAGKTVTAEFAVHAPNATRNPWNNTKSPGTSSSGSAAAVSAGMVPLALGTQTAGSIIRPASYCGVFGFKPSFGTIPRTGMLKTTDSLDTVGLFATNIQDCRLLFDVIRVKGLDYPIVHQKLNDPVIQNKKDAHWKIAVLNDQLPVTKGYSSYAMSALNDFIGTLSSQKNIQIMSLDFPALLSEAHNIQRVIYHKSLSYYFKNEFKNKSLISEVMIEIVEEGNKISFDQYQDALAKQNELTHAVDKLFNGIDVILTLSTAGTAPEFQTAIDPPDTSLIWTMCGCPSISVPAFENANMPFGLQAVSGKYADYKLLNFINYITECRLVPGFSAIK